MKGGDQCSRVFFCKIAKRRASKRVYQITDSIGEVLTSQQAVTNEFITFYQTLLGGSQRVRQIDLRYLRPWARHILSEEEARLLLQPVSTEEIKQAVFDIDETKASGPDDYSSGFFKAAWPIVGREVTRAIMDFFVTGRLLKQVNSTLILLIPKVNNPTVVAEFRPISCCNVLYKVITKILVQRMQGILYTLISPSQNAFVPGRSIGDILLAQELFCGYNQQHLPPRCALKVDLRKAYDTVEWDFLRAVLNLFGFPEQFIGWIVEYVTTPSFSDGGFSYHWKCEAMQLCQLGFADDLLLFSKADTGSVHVFKRALTVFADLSGLQANLHKSHLILSRSAAPLWDTLLAILDFQEGHLPLRVQLIKSVLTALQGNTEVGYAKVSWHQVYRPVSEGGLGIRDLHALNKGLMSRHLWRVITADRSSIWVDWIFHYRLRNLSVWTISDRTGSWGWRKMVRLRDWLQPFVAYKIGNGSSFSLWHDPWHTLGPLIIQFPLGHGTLDGRGGSFSSAAAYDVFCPPGPKVSWSSLLVGTFKIPRHRFILWLAILGRLSTLDKPWLQHLGTSCVLCPNALPETHEHLFCMPICDCMFECDTKGGFLPMALYLLAIGHSVGLGQMEGNAYCQRFTQSVTGFTGLSSLAGTESTCFPAHYTIAY
ncbi:UNVERIFIED_CONTAM: hypothetical protein Slati_2454000 [Sesamum latifolium]|uniref:Reverse transcriptase domain-containing protein n=1 Tax=Sesamum latifolium TaxID=2727402 RepID=A0AAW2WHN1_9LAMI